MKGIPPANVDRIVQLPGIHAMVNDVVSTSDALDRLRLGEEQRRKAPKLETRRQLDQGSLPLPSSTDTHGDVTYPQEYHMDRILRPSPVEPSYKEEVNSNYHQYWSGFGRNSQSQGSDQSHHSRSNSSHQSEQNGSRGSNGLNRSNGAQNGTHNDILNGNGTNGNGTNGPHTPWPHDGKGNGSLRPNGQSDNIKNHLLNGRGNGHGLHLVNGNRRTHSPTHSHSQSNTDQDTPDEGDPPIRRRTNLPKDVTNTLKAWLNDHVDNPYPTEEDKHRLMKETGLTMAQVSNWFINARRRVLNSSHRRGKYRSTRSISYSP